MFRIALFGSYLAKTTSKRGQIASLFARYSRIPSLSSKGNMIGSVIPRYNFTSSGDTTVNPILDEVESKVFQVLKSAAKCKVDKLSRTATFDELGFDSLDGVELVVAMEELFGFDITNEEAEKITSVSEAIAIFNKNLVEKINRHKLKEIQEEETTLAEKKK